MCSVLRMTHLPKEQSMNTLSAAATAPSTALLQRLPLRGVLAFERDRLQKGHQRL